LGGVWLLHHRRPCAPALAEDVCVRSARLGAGVTVGEATANYDRARFRERPLSWIASRCVADHVIKKHHCDGPLKQTIHRERDLNQIFALSFLQGCAGARILSWPLILRPALTSLTFLEAADCGPSAGGRINVVEQAGATTQMVGAPMPPQKS